MTRTAVCDYCLDDLPRDEQGWHVRHDPEGVEGDAHVPCSAVVTPSNSTTFGPFVPHRKKGLTLISLETVPPGTAFMTPEGLNADDEPCHIAYDVNGGVYPIRHSVYEATYVRVDQEAARGTRR